MLIINLYKKKKLKILFKKDELKFTEMIVFHNMLA